MAKGTICAIPNCGKFAYARDWCKAHYQRFLDYGTPWGLGHRRTPREIELAWLDHFSTYRGDDCLKWPFGKGRGQIKFEGSNIRAARMMCIVAHGNPPTPMPPVTRIEVAHTCGYGLWGCINPRHLYWATPKQNRQDSIDHGTIARGERNGESKLTESEVLEILSLKGKMSQRAIAQKFGISQTNVGHIFHRRKWAWLSESRAKPKS